MELNGRENRENSAQVWLDYLTPRWWSDLSIFCQAYYIGMNYSDSISYCFSNIQIICLSLNCIDTGVPVFSENGGYGEV